MPRESDKAMIRRAYNPIFRKIFIGEGLDIGCGDNPAPMQEFPAVTFLNTFDKGQGDAQYITRHVKKQYDFVMSSHCLEHLEDPLVGIIEWFSLVKVNGHLIITVPDEDMYEHGKFPSRFNQDHKWTFTLFKSADLDRHKRSIDLSALLSVLDNCILILAQAIETNYVKSDQSDQTFGIAECALEIVLRKSIIP